MASAIDDTKPVTGTPTTQSVRDNFAAAKSEITALQAAVPTWTVGSVPFAVSTAALGQDNAGLFYDNASDRLGIGTTGPAQKLQVAGNIQYGNTNWIGTLATASYVADDGVIGGSMNNGGGFRIFTGGVAAGNERVRVDSTGNVGIGTAGPGSLLTVNGVCANVSGAWTTISAREMKQDIAPYKRGLDAIVALNPVEFRYAAGTPFALEDEPSRQLFGLLADEVQPHVPEIVGSTTGTVAGKQDVEIDTLEPGLLIFSMINAIKTLKAQLDELKAQLAP